MESKHHAVCDMRAFAALDLLSASRGWFAAVDRITRRLILAHTVVVVVLCTLLLSPDSSQTPNAEPDRPTRSAPERSGPVPVPAEPIRSSVPRPYFAVPSLPERVESAPVQPVERHGIDPKRMLLYRREGLREQTMRDFERWRQLREPSDRPMDRPIRQQ
jgi:hypothetical protein